jgi:AcrR family transcriptional regulator
MTAVTDVSGLPPPRQRRSREVMERVLEAAQALLVEDGLEGLTIAGVAERAGTSVGGVYRRFRDKDHLLAAVKTRLLEELEDTLETRLSQGNLSLRTAVLVFTDAMAQTFGIKYGRVFAELFRGHNPELDELGRRATLNLLACFERAVASHRGEVLRADADAALSTVSSTIISACIHRGVGLGIVSQGVSWPEYASRLGDMCYAYLTTPGP